MNSTGWLRGIVDASTYVSSPHGDSVTNAIVPQLIQPLSASVINAIWDNKTLTAGLVLGLAIILFVGYIRSPWRRVPPGPRRLPILGNSLQLRDKDWLLSKDCKQRFREIMYLDGAGQPIVVCNSLRTAFDLLERRSANYSDRPRFIMAQEILTGGLMFPLMNQDDCWRRFRRASHEALTKKAIQNYHPIQMKEATVLVSSLLKHSVNKNQDDHFKPRATSTILSIVYDYPTVLTDNDPAVEGIERFNNRLAQALAMGTYFVDIFPWMKYIPASLAKWKREGLLAFAEVSDLFLGHFNRVKADLANGGDRPSFCASLIQNPGQDPLSELEKSFLAGTLYTAGTETMTTSMSWFTLAMIAFPKVQQRAQAEIDAVVGRDRLPTFADALRLPYLQAIIKETLRWRPSLPFLVPHVAAEEDWYEGMYMPKGTICIANVWHCNHDPEVFGEDADEFRPERHLDKNGKLVPGPLETNQAGHVTLGFGRRICVGKELVYEWLFINMVRILWAAKLEGLRDENGKQVPLDVETIIDGGAVFRPVPYNSVITPRFAEVESILAEERERFGF